ncbi:MAG TPA: hypothetical protein VGR38_05655 [Candidatus Polarisedimenticolia bacterium]|nr:hypothetical protein [Candidatus Polarisedimenticolia bacterium]
MRQDSGLLPEALRGRNRKLVLSLLLLIAGLVVFSFVFVLLDS